MPDTLMVSIDSPVEKSRAKPSSTLPSFRSLMASAKSMVYVVLAFMVCAYLHPDVAAVGRNLRCFELYGRNHYFVERVFELHILVEDDGDIPAVYVQGSRSGI